jgi:hypothetical protein
MNTIDSNYKDEIDRLKRMIQEKDDQIKKLEQVIEKMYRLYGVKKDMIYKTREDLFSEEISYK